MFHAMEPLEIGFRKVWLHLSPLCYQRARPLCSPSAPVLRLRIQVRSVGPMGSDRVWAGYDRRAQETSGGRAVSVGRASRGKRRLAFLSRTYGLLTRGLSSSSCKDSLDVRHLRMPLTCAPSRPSLQHEA